MNDQLVGKCNQCGMCCKAIVLSMSKLEIINKATKYKNPTRNKTDISFVYKNLVQITRKQALEINPHLEKWSEYNGDKWYFKCKKFDEKTNLCKVHDSRPNMCSQYPWYGKEVTADPLYSPNCGYQADIRI